MHGEEDGFGSEEEEDDASEEGGSQRRGRAHWEKVPPPRILTYKPWEYAESTEELGVAQVFGEVGDVMKYVRTLRGEVRKLHATIRALQPSQLAGVQGAPVTATAAGNGSAQPGSAPPGSNGTAAPSAGSPQRNADPARLINTSRRR